MTSKKELFLVILLSAFFVILSSIPFYYAARTAPSGAVFMGDVGGHFDFNPYITWMEQGRRGHILFKDKYTTEQNPRTLFHPFFLLLGAISRASGLSLRFIAEGARETSGFLLLISLYLFISLFFKEFRLRMLTFCLLWFSSGFGWFLFAFPRITELAGSWVMLATVDLNMFNIVFAPAIHSFSCFLLVLGFYFFVRGLDAGRRPFFILSGLVLALLVFTHPFDFQIFFSVIFLFFLADWIFNKKASPGMLLPLLVALPVLVLQFCASLANTVFREHALGGDATLSSNFIFYLGGLGFLSLFSLLGIAELLSNTFDRPTRQRYLFITLWIVAVPVLLYLPTTFQGRATAGIQLPVTILSVYGIERLLARIKLNKTFVWAAIFLLTLPTNPLLVMHNVENLDRAKGFENKIAPLLDRGIYDAIVWLSNNTDEDKVVFCDWNIGNYIPSVSGNTVFVGHWPQTIDFYKKQGLVASFFSENNSDTERRSILRFSNADYVFYSFKERQLGGFDPDKAKYLKMVYNHQGVKIYGIIKPLL